MIQYEKFTLNNGLRCIVHTDKTTPMVAVNILYDVGAKDESPNKTGFAHLFEHLMFGGSANIPDYDEPLQMAGGENNAYTTNDFTNYYLQLPVQNIETAFWLESDRMNALAFNEKSLDVQRKVVCEEFKEHYINKPYGDTWQCLRSLCYKQHPYQWMTIGKELSHIENASLQDVKDFFYKHYRPVNAILCVAGNINTIEVEKLAKKWFEPIEAGKPYVRNIQPEPTQNESRILTIEKDVPISVIYKAYHIGNRRQKSYYIADMITEILCGGNASRLYQQLVKEQKIFSQIDCYHTGSVENGLVVIEGKIQPHINAQEADKAIENVISTLLNGDITEQELVKINNKIESMLAFEDLALLHRANNLAFYELIGDAALMNKEYDNYKKITIEDIILYAKSIFVPNNSNTLYYLSKKK